MAALRLTGRESVCSEFRALSMARISSGPIECERNGRLNSVMGSDADRCGSLSVTLLRAVGS